ncbi:MAG: HupE/UreJ family protein [Rhodobacterales bacterium]|nr:HupE/UreJ family protein [Rhodobacterales bacterium]
MHDRVAPSKNRLWQALVVVTLVCVPALAAAHGVSGGDQLFLEQSVGAQYIPFAYLGAKHMVTGYDHILFLIGVIFFLYRVKDVAIYVTLFSLGHSTTLLFGVLSGIHINPYLIDAVIGFSVVYKGLDNLGVFKSKLGFQPNTKAAVLVFGLFHGFGLATKLQDFALSDEGLVGNIVSFNVGVEIGQLLALGMVLIAMGFWRRTPSFARQANAANLLLIVAGLGLVVFQLNGYFNA